MIHMFLSIKHLMFLQAVCVLLFFKHFVFYVYQAVCFWLRFVFCLLFRFCLVLYFSYQLSFAFFWCTFLFAVCKTFHVFAGGLCFALSNTFCVLEIRYPLKLFILAYIFMVPLKNSTTKRFVFLLAICFVCNLFSYLSKTVVFVIFWSKIFMFLFFFAGRKYIYVFAVCWLLNI